MSRRSCETYEVSLTHELILIFRLLANGFSYPEGENLTPVFFRAVEETAISSGLETAPLSCSADELQEAYTRLFINSPHGNVVSPYASVYVSGQGLLMQDGLEQARGFYKRAGLELTDDREPADFLPTELFFVALLLENQDLHLLSEFVRNHLWRWFQVFEQRLQAAEPHLYYSLLSKLTLFYLTKLNEEVLNEAT